MTPAQLKQARRRARRAAKAAARQRQLAHRAASGRKRIKRRNASAFGLKGATEFSADQVLKDPVQVIELFKRFAPAACLELITRTTPERERGQAGAPRIEGSWALVFFAHIMAGNPDWQPWYHESQSSRIWDVCGFAQRPSWATTYLRFCELEDPRYVAAFERAAYRFVRSAARHVPHAFDFVHTDGSPGHSHSKLEHACPNQTYCALRVGRVAKNIGRANDETINEDRHERSRAPEPEDPDEPPDNKLHKFSDEEARDLGLSDWRRSRYFRFGARGHNHALPRQGHRRAHVSGRPAHEEEGVGRRLLPARR